MIKPVKVYAFEGEVTQFLPGKRACFVTLAQPIGEVRRALLHATTVNPAYIDSTNLELHDHVTGKLVLGDASIAEVVELN